MTKRKVNSAKWWPWLTWRFGFLVMDYTKWYQDTEKLPRLNPHMTIPHNKTRNVNCIFLRSLTFNLIKGICSSVPCPCYGWSGVSSSITHQEYCGTFISLNIFACHGSNYLGRNYSREHNYLVTYMHSFKLCNHLNSLTLLKAWRSHLVRFCSTDFYL